jgi:two-component system sensor histidine kinase PilS (NtrC family)
MSPDREGLVEAGKRALAVAHDLGTPLQALRANVQLLRERTQDAGTLKLLAEMDEASTLMAGTVADLKSLAVDVPAQRLHIGPVLERALRVAGPAMRARGIQASTTIAAGVPHVWGAANELRRVFTVLLENAAEAMEATPLDRRLLRAGVSAVGGRVVVEVQDWGSGMAPEVLDRAFELGFSTKGRQGGGVGLHGARAIVLAHGGELVLMSQVGVGTMARVFLPVAAEAA